MTKTITALYNNRAEAARAVDNLESTGLSNNDISVLMSDSTHSKEFAVEVNSKAPEGAAIGGAVGGSLGAIAAGMTAVGAVALTGGAGIFAAGPVVAALAGAGAGAAAGGVTGGLIGLGFSENEAKLVDKDVENGSILVSAQVKNDNKDAVQKYFNHSGAKKVYSY